MFVRSILAFVLAFVLTVTNCEPLTQDSFDKAERGCIAAWNHPEVLSELVPACDEKFKALLIASCAIMKPDVMENYALTNYVMLECIGGNKSEECNESLHSLPKWHQKVLGFIHLNFEECKKRWLEASDEEIAQWNK